MLKESREFNCECIDAATIFDLRQALEIAKEKYEEKAKYLLSKDNTTEAGRYYLKIRKANFITDKLKNTKICRN